MNMLNGFVLCKACTLCKTICVHHLYGHFLSICYVMQCVHLSVQNCMILSYFYQLCTFHDIVIYSVNYIMKTHKVHIIMIDIAKHEGYNFARSLAIAGVLFWLHCEASVWHTYC